MGVPPEVWGPNLWGALHTLGLTGTLTPEFVQEFARVIPCPSCGSHFKDLLDEFPLPITTDQFEWTVALHNQVNARIGKPVFTVEQARARWSSRSASHFDLKIVFLILTLVLAILFVCTRK